MALNTQPVQIAFPETWSKTIAGTANTNLDGTGTIADITDAAPVSGTMIEKLKIQAISTTTAGAVRLYIYDGTTWRLWQELSVAAKTVSATVRAAVAGADDGILTPDGWLICNFTLPSTWKLGAAPYQAEAFRAIVCGGDLG
ncbi:MAG: hypothetical protein RL030_2753 [Pseudomonadota bacterium]|jgi:hypothetical protein